MPHGQAESMLCHNPGTIVPSLLEMNKSWSISDTSQVPWVLGATSPLFTITKWGFPWWAAWRIPISLSPITLISLLLLYPQHHHFLWSWGCQQQWNRRLGHDLPTRQLGVPWQSQDPVNHRDAHAEQFFTPVGDYQYLNQVWNGRNWLHGHYHLVLTVSCSMCAFSSLLFRVQFLNVFLFVLLFLLLLW